MESCQGNLSHVHSPEFIPVTREIEDAHCPSLLWNWSTTTTCISVGLTHQNHIEWKVVLQSKIGAILKRKHDKLAHENTKFHDFMKPLFHFSSILFPESQFCNSFSYPWAKMSTVKFTTHIQDLSPPKVSRITSDVEPTISACPDVWAVKWEYNPVLATELTLGKNNHVIILLLWPPEVILYTCVQAS